MRVSPPSFPRTSSSPLARLSAHRPAGAAARSVRGPAFPRREAPALADLELAPTAPGTSRDASPSSRRPAASATEGQSRRPPARCHVRTTAAACLSLDPRVGPPLSMKNRRALFRASGSSKPWWLVGGQGCWSAVSSGISVAARGTIWCRTMPVQANLWRLAPLVRSPNTHRSCPERLNLPAGTCIRAGAYAQRGGTLVPAAVRGSAPAVGETLGHEGRSHVTRTRPRTGSGCWTPGLRRPFPRHGLSCPYCPQRVVAESVSPPP